MAPSFHLLFRPNILLVSTVRRFIAEFYRRVLVDQAEVLIEIVDDVLAVKTGNRSSRERLAGLVVDDRVCIKATSAIAGGRNP